jgi:hypothetical protein
LKPYRYVLVLVGVLLGFAIFWTLSPPAPNRWVIDPAKPRIGGTYAGTVRPPREPPAFDRTFLKSLRVTHTGEGVEIEYQSPNQAEPEPWNYVLKRVAAGQSLRVGTGALSLDLIGVAYTNIPPFDPGGDDHMGVPIRFFDLNGQELSRTQVEALGPEVGDPRLDFRFQFPEVRFLFTNYQAGPMKVLGVHLFDARTHHEVGGSSYTHDQAGDHHYCVNLEARLWHPAPVELVVDVAHGPSETFTLVPEVGQFVAFAGLELRLLAVIDGGGLETSSSYFAGPPPTDTAMFRRYPDLIGKQTSLVFMGLPKAASLPVDFEVIDREDNCVASTCCGSSGVRLSVCFPLGRAQIKSVRIQHLPHVTRGIFEIPFIPGLPRQNQQIRNLLDVRIPFFWIGDEPESERFLSALLQTDLTKGAKPVLPIGYSPRTGRDLTARDVLLDYVNHYPRQFGMRVFQVRINPVTQGVEIAPTPIGRALLWLGKFIK